MPVNRLAVLEAIERAIQAGIRTIDETSDPEIGHTFGAHIRSLCTVESPNPNVVKDVMNVVGQQPDLGWLMESTYVPGPNGGGVGVLPVKVTNWLLAKSLLLSGGPKEALSALEKFAEENSVDAFRVVVICGVHVQEQAQISDSISLLPISMMQPSLGLDYLDENLGNVIYQLPMVRGEGALPEPAIAAFVQHFRMHPALRKNTDSDPSWFVEHKRAFLTLEDLAYAMALIEGAMPQIVSQWVETSPIDAIPGLTGGSGGEFEIMEVIPKRGDRRKTIPSAFVSERLATFLKLPTEARQRLEIPLRRLTLFEARRGLADKAIELGIALESLFGDKEEGSGEIAHKIAVRGSVYASNEVSQRKDNYTLLKQAYNLRSRAVHGGFIQGEKQHKRLKLYPLEVLNQSAALVRKAMNRMVDATHFPDWTDIDLGT